MHAGLDEIITQTAEHGGADVPLVIERRDQIGKDAVKVRHGGDCALIGASISGGAPFRIKLRTLM
jgi:hypothetical protein